MLATDPYIVPAPKNPPALYEVMAATERRPLFSDYQWCRSLLGAFSTFRAVST